MQLKVGDVIGFYTPGELCCPGNYQERQIVKIAPHDSDYCVTAAGGIVLNSTAEVCKIIDGQPTTGMTSLKDVELVEGGAARQT